MNIRLSKKTIIIIASLILVLGIGRLLKVNGYIPKHLLYTSLVKLNILKYCYSASVDMLEMMEQEGFNYEEENKSIVLSSLNKLLDKNIPISDNPKIPTITHRIYFTSEKTPIPLNDFYIEEMKVNFNKLNDLSENWQHNIWTNQIDLIPDEVKNIKAVRVRHISELKDHASYKNLREMIEKGNTLRPYFAEAADLLRLMAVQKFGGIYMDMDYEIYNPSALFNLMKKFDFLAGREIPSRYSYYGNAFIAAKANHPVINEALARSLKHYNIDMHDSTIADYLKYPCNQYDKLYFSGPPLLTISYFSKNNIDNNNDVILPPWMIFNLNFARLKNSISSTGEIEECEYSAIKRADFNRNNSNLLQLLIDYKKNITRADWDVYYNLKDADGKEFAYTNDEKNIYYDLKDRDQFEIIGADMFCGSWTFGGKVFKRKYYWTWFTN